MSEIEQYKATLRAQAALRERLSIKNDKGLVPWKDLEGLMTASGYTITKGTRVNNRPRIMITKL